MTPENRIVVLIYIIFSLYPVMCFSRLSLQLFFYFSSTLLFYTLFFHHFLILFLLSFFPAGTVRRADIVVAAVGRAEMVKKVRTTICSHSLRFCSQQEHMLWAWQYEIHLNEHHFLSILRSSIFNLSTLAFYIFFLMFSGMVETRSRCDRCWNQLCWWRSWQERYVCWNEQLWFYYESSYHQFLSGKKNLTGNLIPLNPTFSYFFIVLFIFFNCKFNYLIIFALTFSSLNLCDSIIYRLPPSWWRGLCRLQRGRFKDHTGERGRRRREIYLLLFIW